MSKSRFVIFFIVVLIAFIDFIHELQKDRKEANTYFRSLDLVLKGVVQSTDRPPNYNGFDILEVSVVTSNRSFYDPRKERAFYYCLIKKDKAEFYQLGMGRLQPGDTIEVETKNRIFKITRRDSVFKVPMLLNKDPNFFDYVKRHHQNF